MRMLSISNGNWKCFSLELLYIFFVLKFLKLLRSCEWNLEKTKIFPLSRFI